MNNIDRSSNNNYYYSCAWRYSRIIRLVIVLVKAFLININLADDDAEFVPYASISSVSHRHSVTLQGRGDRAQRALHTRIDVGPVVQHIQGRRSGNEASFGAQRRGQSLAPGNIADTEGRRCRRGRVHCNVLSFGSFHNVHRQGVISPRPRRRRRSAGAIDQSASTARWRTFLTVSQIAETKK